MGRPSTGAWTVYESLRLELPYLLKQGLIKKGRVISFINSWSSNHEKDYASISCVSSYLEDQQYLKVSYSITSRDGSKTNHNYKIYFFEQESNLGKGKVLYFICPVSNLKCRILYKAYDCDVFKARQAYRNRLYYDCQHSSKLSKYNDSYWRLDKQLKKMEKEASFGNRTYQGLLTKKAVRYNKLALKQAKMDELRWTAGVPKCFRGRLKGLI